MPDPVVSTPHEVPDPPRHVACDGGNGGLGHPRVYLEFDHEGRTVCPYCSRTFTAGEASEAGATA